MSDEGAPAAPSTCASRASSLRAPLWCRHSVIEQKNTEDRASLRAWANTRANENVPHRDVQTQLT